MGSFCSQVWPHANSTALTFLAVLQNEEPINKYVTTTGEKCKNLTFKHSINQKKQILEFSHHAIRLLLIN